MRYRKIDPRMWNDEKFRGLSDDGKLVFIFLLTHPNMTALGAMRATVAGLAAELGWSEKRFRAALKQLVQPKMVEINESACFAALPNFIRYNEPEGPNSVTKAWIASLDLLPECHEKRRLIRRCKSYLESRSDKFKDALGNPIWDALRDAIQDAKPEPCPIQDQEQEQEPEPESNILPFAADDCFENFWEVYPRKVAKERARQVWRKLNPDGNLEVLIIAAVTKHKASPQWQKDEGQFIPHPATWLNQKRWQDAGVTLTSVPKTVAEML